MRSLFPNILVLSAVIASAWGNPSFASPAGNSTRAHAAPIVHKCVISTRCERVIDEHTGTAIGDPDFFNQLNSHPDSVRFTLVYRENGNREVWQSKWTSRFRCDIGCGGADYVRAWNNDMPSMEQSCRDMADRYHDAWDACAPQVGALEKVDDKVVEQNASLKNPIDIPAVGGAQEVGGLKVNQGL